MIRDLGKQIAIVLLSVSLAGFVIAETEDDGWMSYLEGAAAYEAKKYALALSKWLEAAEQGYASAQNNLGVMYGNGEGVPQNYAEAVKWYRLAAEQGYASAQNNLGVMYNDGRGVPQNYAEAVKWYRLAAEQGYALAQFGLGVMYHEGRGVPQNGVMAYVWESLAAAQGYEVAKYNRGISAEQLTPEQLARAQEIAARCFESNYKDCN